MKMTPTKERSLLREKYVGELIKVLEQNGEEILRTKSNEIAFPIVSDNGNEYFLRIVVSVPTGSRDGDGYDAYELAEDYKHLLEQKAIKKAKAEEKKKKGK